MRRSLSLLLVLAALLVPVLARATPASASTGLSSCATPQIVPVPTLAGYDQQYVEKNVMWPRLQKLIQLVNATGHVLTIESGYRSCDTQVELRKENCGTSNYAVYQEPSVDCTPDTAIPGSSNHQYGLAVDFGCDGRLIRDNAACQGVVKQYAPQAQLVNYTPEVWHWGVQDENNPTGDYAADHVPDGSVDAVTDVPGGERVSGWVADPDTASPVQVWVEVDGVVAALVTADASRPDVQAAGAARGAASGVNAVVPMSSGSHHVCFAGQGDQPNRQAVVTTCKDVTVRGPVGTLDAATPAPGGIGVSGWGYDPDATSSALDTRILLDGSEATQVAANSYRPDVDRATGAGPNHGFRTVLAVPVGTHQVCAVGVDAPTGYANTLLGCRSVTLSAPVGSFDLAVATTGGVHVAGWAFDPDTTGAAQAVRVFVDGAERSPVSATTARPDVDAVYGSGANHGFDATVPTTGGTHTVCLVLTDAPTGAFTTSLGCRTTPPPATVGRGQADLGHSTTGPHRHG